MVRNAQIRAKKLSAAVIGCFAICLVIPTGAWAGSNYFGFSWNQHRAHTDHGKHDRHADQRDHRRGHDDRHGSKKGSKKHRYDRHDNRHDYDRHDYSGHRRDSRHIYGNQAPRYFCKPCNHYFSSRNSLYHHASDHHHIPFWRLTNAILFTTLGFVFSGY